MIKLLLLEDDEKQCKLFMDRFQSDQVKVKAVQKVDQVFHELDNESYDIAVIDPVMSHTMDFPRLLDELRKRNIEINIIYPGKFIPSFKREADKRHIESVSMNDPTALYAIIEKLIKNRSSGVTSEIRKDQREMEIRSIKTEMGLAELGKDLNEQSGKIKQIEDVIHTQSTKLIELGNNQNIMINQLTNISETVSGLGKELKEIKKEDPQTQIKIKLEEEKTKRFIAIVTIATTVITTIGIIAIPAKDIIIKWFESTESRILPKK